MVTSGINATDEITKAFGEVKINRSSKGLVLSIDSNNKELLLEKLLDKGCEYKEILEYLPKDDPR